MILTVRHFLLPVMTGLLCLLSVGCQDDVSIERFGLDYAVSLDIDPENIATLYQGIWSKSPVPVSLDLNGERRRGRISFSGASTLDDLKKSFEISLENPIMGQNTWRLNNISRDESTMRMLLAYRVFRLSGVDMPILAPIAVWLNNSYLGLYLLQEQFDETYFENRSLHPASLYQAQDNISSMENCSSVSTEFSAKIGSDEMGDLERLICALNDPTHDWTLQPLDTMIHMDSLINYLAVSAYIRNTDGIRNNFFMLRYAGDERFRILPWDFDFAFHPPWTPATGVMVAFDQNRMMQMVMNNETFFAAYQKRFAEIAAGANNGVLQGWIDELFPQLRDAYQADPVLSRGTVTYEQAVAALRQLIERMAAAGNAGER